MFIVNSYTLAIVLCVVTMLCWGSWGNTQKLAGKTWRYELFYWDYVIGILIFSLLMSFWLCYRGRYRLQPFQYPALRIDILGRSFRSIPSGCGIGTCVGRIQHLFLFWLE